MHTAASAATFDGAPNFALHRICCSIRSRQVVGKEISD